MGRKSFVLGVIFLAAYSVCYAGFSTDILGVGTTHPQKTLDVVGNIMIPSTTGPAYGTVYVNDPAEGIITLLHTFGKNSAWNGNIFVGPKAGNFTMNATSCSDETALGYQALSTLTTGGDNTAVGAYAGQITSGYYNTAVGNGALDSMAVTGDSNTAVGNKALDGITSGSLNTAIGDYAGGLLTTGSNNTMIGAETGNWFVVSGSNNVMLGFQAGYFADTGTSDRLFIQNSKFRQPLIYGQFDTARVSIGNTNPTFNLDVTGSIRASTTGAFKTLQFGTQLNTLPADTGTSGQVLQTDGAGTVSWATPAATATPGGNVGDVQFNNTTFAGDDGLYWDNTNKRLGIGTTAPQKALDVKNIIIPSTTTGPASKGVLYVNDPLDGIVPLLHTGQPTYWGESIYVGPKSGNFTMSAFTATNNSGFGYATLKSLTTGGNNTAIGNNAGALMTTGGHNTVVGSNALAQGVVTGSYNVAVGDSALIALDGGSSNVVLGDTAGEQMTTGSNNVLIGDTAGENLMDGSNNVLLGYQAGYYIGSGVSNKLFIQNDKTRQPLIYGVFDTGLVAINNTNPSYTLDVTGNIRASTTVTAKTLQFGTQVNTLPAGTGTNGQILETNGTGGILWATPSGLTQWETNGSDIGFQSGNVGVGLTNPSYQLQVSGTAAAQTLRFGTLLDNTLPAGTGASGQILQANGTGGITWETAGAAGANTELSNLTTTAINTSLNFAYGTDYGIFINSPPGTGTGGNLTIQSGNAGGSEPGGNLILVAGNSDQDGDGGKVEIDAGAGGQYGGNGGPITLFTGGPQSGNNANGGELDLGTANGYGTGNGGDIYLYTGNGGDTGQSGAIYFGTGSSPYTVIKEGNVGIGTTAPIDALEIANGGNIYFSGADCGVYMNSSETDGFSLNLGGGTSTDTTGDYQGGYVNIIGGAGGGGGGDIQITGGTVNAPYSYPGGDVIIRGGNGGVVSGQAKGGDVSIISGAGGSASGNSGNIRLSMGSVVSGTPGVISLTGGNVGVGLTNPSANLHVNGTVIFDGTTPEAFLINQTGSVHAARISQLSASTGNHLSFTTPESGTAPTAGLDIGLEASDGITAQIKNNENSPLEFYTNKLHRMTILADGKVGIGTTAPGVALDVIGAVRTSNTETLLCLDIQNASSANANIGKRMTETMVFDYAILQCQNNTAGTSTQVSLKIVGADGTTPLTNLFIGQTGALNPLTVTTGAGTTIPAGEKLSVYIESQTGGTSPDTTIDVKGHQYRP